MEPYDVIIPIYKPKREFNSLLVKIYSQSIKPQGIYVINTGKEKKEDIIDINADYFKSIKWYNVSISEFDHAATRQQAMSYTTANRVMYMTQDAIPNNEYLAEELLKALSDENVAMAYARQLPRKDTKPAERYTRQFNYPDKSIIKSKDDIDRLGIKTYFCSDVCSMYNKSIFISLGGFVKKAIFNEDTFYASKAINNDYKVAYVATAEVVHAHNYSCIQQMKRNFDLGVSHIQYKELLEGIKSESEGIKLVKNTAKHLTKIGKVYLVPMLCINSGFKLIGYKLGKNYKKLPKWLVLKMTSNKHYWA